MKYIRTNYLLGEIISHTKLLNGTHLFSIKDLDEILPISEEDIEKCKVADTIEDLCDEFVCVLNEKTHWLSPFKTFEIAKEQDNYTDLYGAIWTSKGLIYVAKMNEKGELELL